MDLPSSPNSTYMSTQIATSTSTPTPTPAPTLTLTPTPSPSPSPSPTFTPSLPISLGTPLPPLQNFNDEIEDLELVGRLVSPYPIGQLNENGYQVSIYTDKIVIYQEGSEHTEVIVPLTVSIFPMGPKNKISVGKNRIAVGGKNKVTIYDWSGQKVRQFAVDDADSLIDVQVAVSPDGKFLAYAYLQKEIDPSNWKLAFWFYVVDIETGETRFRQHGFYPLFSRDGERLIVTFDNSLYVYDIKKGKEVYNIWLQNEYTSNYTLSGDGVRVALYDEEEGVVHIYNQSKILRSIHWRQWTVSKPKDLSISLSFHGKQVLLSGRDVEGWKQGLFDVETGQKLEISKVCNFYKWDGDQLKCIPQQEESSHLWSPWFNYFWQHEGNWYFGDVMAQYCHVTPQEYTCAWEPMPEEVRPPYYQDPNTLIQWWKPQRVLWVQMDYPLQSVVTAFDEAGNELWEVTLPEGRWPDGRRLTGVALSPDRTLLALVSINEIMYYMYNKPMPVNIQYLVLQQGVQRPPQISFETSSEYATWQNTALAFCPNGQLVIAIPGSVVRFYEVETATQIGELEVPTTAILKGVVCTNTTLTFLDENGTLWIYGWPKQDR